jgi:uncharacterized protein (UPF0264 family)
LLVSVSDAVDALAALEGGADIIDAKNPLAGALGTVSPDTLRDIREAVGGRRPVTAALGDATDEDAIERLAASFAGSGAELVKVGFAGVSSAARVAALTSAAVRGAREGSKGAAGVVAVAYADGTPSSSIGPLALAGIASLAGARGVLLDTADKDGPGLRALLSPDALAAFIDNAHDCGLFVALAGKLTADDLPAVRDAGADVAGVRGAACEGGRAGRITAVRVRQLLTAIGNHERTASVERNKSRLSAGTTTGVT